MFKHIALCVLIAFTLLVPTSAQTSGCSLSISAASGMGRGLVRTTGNPTMDQHFVQEVVSLNVAMSVYPALFILDDSGSPNAYANPEVVDERFPDGAVMLGYSLLNSEWAQSSGVNFSIPTIMAHEFGHIAQFKSGLRLPTKLLELQADYLAGWYMANRQRDSTWTPRALADSLRSLFSKGDYQFNSPNHHGTPQQRTSAFMQGFQNGNASFKDVLKRSFDFVKQ
jgi:hypothetical protein